MPLEAAWLSAPCRPDFVTIGEADAALLRFLLRVDQMSNKHPVRTWWTVCSPLARAVMHHLADDLRSCMAVPDVPGFKKLVQRLRNDVDGFEDHRYELRVAANIARGREQKLLRFGASAQGPDVVAMTVTGHELGIACYRASSQTPDFKRARATFERLATLALALFRTPSAYDGHMIAVEFPEFPLRPFDEELASHLLGSLWRDPTLGEIVRRGLRVATAHVPKAFPLPTDKRALRIRFTTPIADWERARLERHVLEKVAKEEHWARTAPNAAFFLEESNYADVVHLKKILEGHAQSAGTFGLYVVTEQGYADYGDGLPHGFEELSVVVSERSNGLHINLETFGDNLEVWGGRGAVVSVEWDHAAEEYELVQTSATQVNCGIRKALGSGKRLVRIPPEIVALGPKSPEFLEAVTAATTRLMAERRDAEEPVNRPA